MSIPTHRRALERADKIIGWMAEYIGRMATPDNGIHDLNEHWLYMEKLRQKESHIFLNAKLKSEARSKGR